MTFASAPRVANLDLRLLRALPFATVCVLVSALGHALAGGGPVPLSTLLVGLLLVLLTATALAGRERRLPAIAGGLALGEFGLHVLFHLAQGGSPAMAGMSAMPGMRGMGAASATGPDPLTQLAARLICGPGPADGLVLPPGTTARQIVSQAGLDPHRYLASLPAAHAGATGTGGAWALLGLTPLMLVGHLLAALVAAWWLRRGEAALFQLLGLTLEPLRQLLRLLGSLGGLPVPAVRPVPRWAAESWRLPSRTRLRHQLVRRGPPRLLLA
jgi:hypothetical protein